MITDKQIEKALNDFLESPMKAVEKAIGNYKKMVAKYKRQEEEYRLVDEAIERRFKEAITEYNQRFGS